MLRDRVIIKELRRKSRPCFSMWKKPPSASEEFSAVDKKDKALMWIPAPLNEFGAFQVRHCTWKGRFDMS